MATIVQNNRYSKLTNFTVTTTGNESAVIPAGYGWLLSVDSDPDGSTVPTALWDFVVTDAGSRDLLGGAGANRSATDKDSVTPLRQGVAGPVEFSGDLTLTTSNAGSGIVVHTVFLLRP